MQKFTPVSAIWIGGVHFKVKTIKKALKWIVKGRLFTDEALCTFLIEVKSIINSCFLTAASDDINDLELITTNHVLIG